MGHATKIEWCDATFNPWRGCAKTSPGCKHCYAERQATRNPGLLGTWGPAGTRPLANETYWRQAKQWQGKAERTGRRLRVFCGSMMDVFEDRPDLEEPRRRLFNTIYETPALDWLILTKRPRVMFDWLGGLSGMGWGAFAEHFPNAWLGTSIENQATADERLPILAECRARFLFVSAEPLLEPIKIRPWLDQAIAWCIIGGESGPQARPCDILWIDALRNDCLATDTACFIKQLGSNAMANGKPLRLHHPKGADPAAWPNQLRCREFPADQTMEQRHP